MVLHDVWFSMKNPPDTDRHPTFEGDCAMGILADAFLATQSEALAAPLGSTSPSRLFPTVEGKRLASLELTCLQMALQHQDPDALDVATLVT
jgi:hypothetical protein